ncbi:MAG TPA: helicase-related protein, partial [Acidovorax sp.]|nr:helicase-related protein [Acidovorax sp.]
VLVPMRVFSCTTADMTGAETSGGEWTDTAAAKRGMEIVGDVVAEWSKYGEGRKTIVFGATIAHCEELCRQFIEAGVMASVFTSDTLPAERLELLKEYRKPDSALRVLISVEALAKGFDVPDVGCVVDCRPLRKSLSTAIQMWGRGLRASPETGKTDCILLDHSGNILRFAEDYTKIFFDGLDVLDMGETLDKAVRKEPEDGDKKGCPSCGYKPFKKRCMSCGFEIVDQAMVEQVPGHMREVLIGKAKTAENHQHLWAQACAYARAHGTPEKMQGRAAHIFKDIVGAWPPRSWHIDTTPGCEISKALMNKIKSRNIAFARARKAVPA